jgi:site-specific DNA recombinase
MKAVLLARVSTQEQKEAGNSLPAQVFRLQEYIERHPTLIKDEEFTFDETAYKEGRNKLDSVLDYINSSNGVIALCCDKVDRLARDFLVFLPKIERFRRTGKIELHFPSDNLVLTQNSPATDLFHFNIAVSLAQYYSDAISDNTKRALEQRLRDGRWIGPPRIGYIKVLDEKGNSFHDKDPDKVHLIVKMFELYATGNHSVKTIRDVTYDLGLRSKAGKKLSPSMVHKMIKDKFYIGTMTSKGVEYPHIYPRIVSKELFKKVQDILASHKKQPHKKASKPFVFRGIIKCKKCGCSISPELKKGKYIYYSCSNYKGICERVFVREEDLLKPIQKLMESIQMPEERMNVIVDDLKSFTQNKNQFHERMVKQLQKEYNEIQDNLDNLIDLLVSRRITQDIYDKKLKQFKTKQNDLNTQLQEYTNADEKYHIVASTVFSLANRALEIFESSEPNEKRQLLNFLVQNCLLSGKNLEFSIRSPFNLIQETAHHSIGLPR